MKLSQATYKHILIVRQAKAEQIVPMPSLGWVAAHSSNTSLWFKFRPFFVSSFFLFGRLTIQRCALSLLGASLSLHTKEIAQKVGIAINQDNIQMYDRSQAKDSLKTGQTGELICESYVTFDGKIFKTYNCAILNF